MVEKHQRVIVLDTSAFIAGTDSLYSLTGLIDENGNPLETRQSGDDEEVMLCTTHDVLREVKDPTARKRLKLLDGVLKLRKPSEQALATVIEFTKMSGDYASLSLTDIRIIALAWMLEHERNGTKFLKLPTDIRDIRKPRGIPAHILDEREEAQRLEAEAKAKENNDDEDEAWNTVAAKPRPMSKQEVKRMKRKQKRARKRSEAEARTDEVTNRDSTTDLPAKSLTVQPITHCDEDVSQIVADVTDVRNVDNIDEEQEPKSPAGIQDVNAVDEEQQEDVPDDDDDGWITAENVDAHLAEDAGQQDASTKDAGRIECVTTDYSMQNVLIQMGIKVISTDGRRIIKQIKRFVLRCHACSAIERDVTKKFCDKCGNATLHKVAFKVNKKGVARVFVNHNYKPNLRGTKYSIPLPRGGRHNKDLILRADQIDPVKLRRFQKQKARLDIDVLDPGSFYNAGAKFAAHRDLTMVGYGRRNPNESRPKSGSRKK